MTSGITERSAIFFSDWMKSISYKTTLLPACDYLRTGNLSERVKHSYCLLLDKAEAQESRYSIGVVLYKAAARAWTRNLLCVQFVLFRPEN